LLERVEALHSLLDLLEAADSLDRTEEALNFLDEGLAEVDDLFQLRRRFFGR
jgi:ribosome assembly protein YihI (activator of Der GTPase)